MKKFPFILLFATCLILLAAEEAGAQTASSRPISDVLTERIKQQLAKKQGGVPPNSALDYNKLPSGNPLPKQAIEAGEKYNAAGHANSGRKDLLPGNSALKANEVRQRNMQKLATVKGKAGR